MRVIIILFMSILSMSMVAQSWELSEYKDEFGDPSGDKYARITMSGKFSNSATTNANLFAALVSTKEDLYFMLFEYGSNTVKAYSTTEYKIKVKTVDSVLTFSGTMYSGGTALFIKDREEFLKLLITEPKLKVAIKEVSSGYASTYIFILLTKGFEEVYEKL